LASHTDGGDGASAEVRLGQTYDLAGALSQKPRLALPLGGDPELDRALRTRAPILYTPLYNDPLAADPAIHQALLDSPDGMVADAWWTLIKKHPLLYLKTRWADFAAVVATPDPTTCHFAVVGVTGPPERLKQLGLKAGIRPQDKALADYTKVLFHTPVFSHLAWGTLAIVLLFILLRRADPSDVAVAGLLVGTVLFAISFAIISIACDYRYLVFLDLSAMAATLYLVKKA
jgi:hypothetical protein